MPFATLITSSVLPRIIRWSTSSISAHARILSRTTGSRRDSRPGERLRPSTEWRRKRWTRAVGIVSCRDSCPGSGGLHLPHSSPSVRSWYRNQPSDRKRLDRIGSDIFRSHPLFPQSSTVERPRRLLIEVSTRFRCRRGTLRGCRMTPHDRRLGHIRDVQAQNPRSRVRSPGRVVSALGSPAA